MIELAQHIETLLLENDCVIIPSLGGFVAHYTTAERVDTENLFLPPTRTIGFNSKLKMNDGLLVQSFMSVYGTTFSDATKMVDQKVQGLFSTLYQTGKIELPNIGDIYHSIDGNYTFQPYENKLTSPQFYGLGSFEMFELTTLKQRHNVQTTSYQSKKVTIPQLNLNYTAMLQTAAMVAIIFVLSVLSTPIKNTDSVRNNQAWILPNELFDQIKGNSLITKPINNSKIDLPKPIASISTNTNEVINNKEDKEHSIASEQNKQVTLDVTTNNTQSTQPKIEHNKNNTKRYHIIVASLPSIHAAQKQAQLLQEEGNEEAQAIICGTKMRVSIKSYSNKDEANDAVIHLRKKPQYQGAWVLRK